MEITPKTLYWLTRMDNLVGLSIILSFITAIGFIIMLIVMGSNSSRYGEEEEFLFKLGKLWSWVCGILFIFSTAACVFLPSTKEMLIIYGVPALVESRVVQKDIPQLYDHVIEALNDVLENSKKKEH